IPAHLHLEQLNSHIEGNHAVRIPRQMSQRPVGAPADGAVNGFGFSGTSAHVILDRAPPVADQEVARQESTRPLQLLTMSARSEEELRAMTGHYVADLVKTEAPLADVALTSQTAREHAGYRIAVVAPTSEVAVERLVEFGREGRAPGVYQGEVLGTTG